MGIYSIIEKKKKAKKRNERIKIAKVAGTTAVVGTAVGVVTGILVAPKSGKETRADIAEKTAQTKEQIKEKSVKLKENLSTKMEAGKQDIISAKAKISDYLESKRSKTVDEVEVDEEENEEVEKM